MGKIYTALGLMSGTSMDGVDASIVSSINGIQYDENFSRYYEYDRELYQNISIIRDKIFTSADLKRSEGPRPLQALTNAAETIMDDRSVLFISNSYNINPIPIIGYESFCTISSSKGLSSLNNSINCLNETLSLSAVDLRTIPLRYPK